MVEVLKLIESRKSLYQKVINYSLSDSKSGYVCFFTPDGKLASKRGENEYVQRSRDGSKIHNMLKYLSDAVLTSKAAAGILFALFADNHFTLPKTIREFRRRKIAMIETARPKTKMGLLNL